MEDYESISINELGKQEGGQEMRKEEMMDEFGGEEESTEASFESVSSSLSSSEEDEEDDGVGEKWIEHYCSSQRILLVGEGDFSFSLSLAKAFGSATNMVATSLDTHKDLEKKYSDGIGNVRELEEMGCIVLCGVDATQMIHHYFLTTQRFDRIVYNFPHVGFIYPEPNGCQIKLNKELVKGFLKNAKLLLRKEKGEIHVTHKVGDPYDKWDLVKKAEKIGLVLQESIPFPKHKYPGYNNKRAHGRLSDDPFPLGACATFKFRIRHSSV